MGRVVVAVLVRMLMRRVARRLGIAAALVVLDTLVIAVGGAMSMGSVSVLAPPGPLVEGHEQQAP